MRKLAGFILLLIILYYCLSFFDQWLGRVMGEDVHFVIICACSET